jgi:hypothetical protein
LFRRWLDGTAFGDVEGAEPLGHRKRTNPTQNIRPESVALLIHAIIWESRKTGWVVWRNFALLDKDSDSFVASCKPLSPFFLLPGYFDCYWLYICLQKLVVEWPLIPSWCFRTRESRSSVCHVLSKSVSYWQRRVGHGHYSMNEELYIH